MSTIALNATLFCPLPHTVTRQSSILVSTPFFLAGSEGSSGARLASLLFSPRGAGVPF
jgi:hypothetical protein